MHPILFKLGPVAIYSYGLMVALGFLAAVFVIWRLAREEEIEEEKLFDGILTTFFFGISGARVYYVLLNWEIFSKDYLRIIHLIAYPGLGIMGALMGGLIGFFVFCKVNKLEFGKVADLGVIGLSLGQAIGRIGCFLNGCCYGKVTDALWGVLFPGLSGRRHPTQLYEAVLDFFIFVILYKIRKNWIYITGRPLREGRRGGIFLSYFFLYGIARLVVELFRADSVYYAGINLAVLISAGFIVSSLVFLMIFFRKDFVYLGNKVYKEARETDFKSFVAKKISDNFSWVRNFFGKLKKEKKNE